MGILKAVLGPVLNFIGKPIERWQEEKRAVTDAKQRRKTMLVENDAKWEEAVLIKSGVVLRWACGLHLFAGMDYTIYAAFSGRDPDQLWNAMALIPEWYTGLLATMFGFAFASAPLKKVGGSMVQGWSKHRERREHRQIARERIKAGIPPLDLNDRGDTERRAE